MTFFDDLYVGTPPWDTGRPQSEIVRLADAGAITGRVLDVGCGTGENAIELAQRGLPVLGIDASPRAIAKARAKAEERRSTAEFLVWDALDLASLGRTFDTAIDSGLFHVFSDEERPRFAESLASVLAPGGRYFLMCFSEHQPGEWGPRRVTQQEIRETFAGRWRVDSMAQARFDTNFAESIHAWVAKLTRV